MSLTEKFKSHILKTIEKFTSNNFEPSKLKPLTNREIRKVLFEIQESNLEDEIRTETINNISLIESQWNNLQDFNQTKDLINDIESLCNKSVEICRNAEAGISNKTVIIEEPLNLSDKNATKMPTSPVVLISNIGRTDTFEICPSVTVNQENLHAKSSQDFMKKLEDLENKLLGFCTEFTEMKKQFQMEVNHTSERKMNKFPTPSKVTFRTLTLTETPKPGSSPRRSNSFSSVIERKKLLTKPYPISALLAPKKVKIAKEELQGKKDIKNIPKNPKYANVQSTIPKSSPLSKLPSKLPSKRK